MHGVRAVEAIMIFRTGVLPEWEDPANAGGGHFQFLLPATLGAGQIDEFWNNVVFGVIGSVIAPPSQVQGVRLVDKLQSFGCVQLEVWFANYDDTEMVETLRSSFFSCMSTALDGSRI